MRLLDSTAALAAIVAGIYACAAAAAQCAQELDALTSPSGPSADAFGLSVGIQGQRLVVGAPADDEAGQNAGAAHVFRFSGVQWLPEVKLIAITADGEDDFGRSVALDGNFVVVGGPQSDIFGNLPGSGVAAVFFFRESDQMWTQDTTLNAEFPAARDVFGTSVAIDGDVIVVGAPGDSTGGTLSGAAYVWRRNPDTLGWTFEARLAPADPAPFKFFGDSVAVEGDSIIVGAWGDNNHHGLGAGAAYAYRHVDGAWTFEQKFTGSGITEGANFGKRVSMSDGRAVITADNAFILFVSIGAAYIFHHDDGGWSEDAVLVPAEPLQDEQFGVSAALSGNVALIGGTYQDPNQPDPNNPVEQRWAFAFADNGDGWEQVDRIQPSDPINGQIFNWNLALDGTTALVGSFERSGGGSAYLFDLSNCVIVDIPCPGDVNGDRTVDLADLATLLANFGTSGGATREMGDLDGDADVDLSDLATLLANFGAVCPVP